jgi:hypothetical protein
MSFCSTNQPLKAELPTVGQINQVYIIFSDHTNILGSPTLCRIKSKLASFAS